MGGPNHYIWSIFMFPIINKAIEYGELVHCITMQMGFEQDIYFGNSMLRGVVEMWEYW